MKNVKAMPVAALALFSVTLFAQSNNYQKAGTISIKDNKAIAAGTIRDNGNLFSIGLEEVGVYDGHICGCNTAGFLITKTVLEQFYPHEISSRNTMNIRISSYTQDLVDAIEFITGNRLNGGLYTNTPSDFIVDSSLIASEGQVVFVFERKDNGDKIKVVLDKTKLLTKEEMQTIKTIKPKMANKTATQSEKKQFAMVTRAIVDKLILALPKVAITYEKI